MCCHNTDEARHPVSCIRRVPVFEQLSDEEIAVLQEGTTSKRYAKGEIVFREGEKSDSLFVLSEGLIKISKISDNGKEHIVRFLFPGDFFGQFALLGDKTHYANAEVVESAVVCRVSRDDFMPKLESHPALAYRFLLAMSDLLQQADEWAGALHMYEAERRLAKLILHFLEKSVDDGLLRLPAAKKELALMIGTTPETLSRKLAQLEQARLIEVDKRTVRVLKPAELQALAGTGPN